MRDNSIGSSMAERGQQLTKAALEAQDLRLRYDMHKMRATFNSNGSNKLCYEIISLPDGHRLQCVRGHGKSRDFGKATYPGTGSLVCKH